MRCGHDLAALVAHGMQRAGGVQRHEGVDDIGYGGEASRCLIEGLTQRQLQILHARLLICFQHLG